MDSELEVSIFLPEYSPHPMINSNIFGAIEIKKALLKSLSKVDSAETLSILGGDEGIRTPDLYVANVPLSHLSYIPTFQAIPEIPFRLV